MTLIWIWTEIDKVLSYAKSTLQTTEEIESNWKKQKMSDKWIPFKVL